MPDPIDEDEILAVLNGTAAPAAKTAKADPDALPYIDAEPGRAPSRDAQLTVLPPTPKPAAQAADEKHAVAAGGAGYRVDVRGDYYAPNPDGKGKIKKPYDLSFNVPRAEGAPSVIKNKLLLPALRRKHPEATRHRTFRVVRIVPRDPSKTAKSNNLAYMDRDQLEQYVVFARVPVDVASYPKTDEGTLDLRESIIDFVQNPDPVRLDEKGKNTVNPGDPGTFLARERERQAERQGDRELADLNPDLELT
jgi:hypothetical protein